MKASVFANKDNKSNGNQVHEMSNIRNKIIYPYQALIVEVLFILLRFFGFLFCLKAFSIESIISKGELISSFCLAWIVGLVVPAAPGGLGVFESVILFGLGTKLPEAPLLASLLCYRLVSTISDLSAAIVYPLKDLFLRFKFG